MPGHKGNTYLNIEILEKTEKEKVFPHPEIKHVSSQASGSQAGEWTSISRRPCEDADGLDPPQSVCFRRSGGVGPRICISHEFPGDPARSEDPTLRTTAPSQAPPASALLASLLWACSVHCRMFSHPWALLTRSQWHPSPQNDNQNISRHYQMSSGG